jgi:hypothetical protein
MDSPKQSVTGIVLIMLGLPVYWYFNKYGTPMDDGDGELDNGDTKNEKG